MKLCVGGRGAVVAALLAAVVACRSAPPAAAAEFEGLVLLKRYAAAAEACRACDEVRLGALPRDLPTARPTPATGLNNAPLSLGPVEWVLQTNGSAVVNAGDDYIKNPTSCGKPLPIVTMKTVDVETGADLPGR